MTLCSIIFNGQTLSVPQGCTLEQLLQQQELSPTAVATAIDAQFVPRHQRAQRQLQNGHVVTTFAPIVGG